MLYDIDSIIPIDHEKAFNKLKKYFLFNTFLRIKNSNWAY